MKSYTMKYTMKSKRSDTLNILPESTQTDNSSSKSFFLPDGVKKKKLLINFCKISQSKIRLNLQSQLKVKIYK